MLYLILFVFFWITTILSYKQMKSSFNNHYGKYTEKIRNDNFIFFFFSVFFCIVFFIMMLFSLIF